MKSTKIIFSLFAFAFSLVLFGQVSYAQTETIRLEENRVSDNNSNLTSIPKVVVKVKSQGEINPFFSQIDVLTAGDEILSEQVVFEIFRNRSTKLVRIVSEKNYHKLSDEEKAESIIESEVKEIIVNIKSR